jgi:abhydrolase domain-containing protein 17
MNQFLFKKILFGKITSKKLGLSLLILYVVSAICIFFKADSLIFLPQPASYQDTKDILKLSISSNEKISAIHLPNYQSAYTLLYIHGNAEDLGDIRPSLDRLHGWGFNVFAYDNRGYGTSDGKPSEANAYQDADIAYTYLTKELKIPPNQIIVYGRSVGGGAATELATRHPIAGLVLESTFTSAFRVILPFPLLPFDKLANIDKLQRIHRPVLIMHGQSDRTIPIQHSHTLYEAALNPKMSLWIAEAGHDDFTEIAGNRHQQALLSFQQLIKTHPKSN